MRTETIVLSTLDSHQPQFGYFLDEEWNTIDTREDIKEAAELLKASPELIEAIKDSLTLMAENIETDLRDLWGRLDEVEMGA